MRMKKLNITKWFSLCLATCILISAITVPAVAAGQQIETITITYAKTEVTEFTAAPGDWVPLSVKIEPAGAEFDEEIIWTSSDTSVFEVAKSNPEGTDAIVTTIGSGTAEVATLTVSIGDVRAECIVHVIRDEITTEYVPPNRDDAKTVAAQIQGWNGGGIGSLSAIASGNTVTVTGTVKGATEWLKLNTSKEVTLIWRADLSGTVSNTFGLVYNYGEGAVIVEEGGRIEAWISPDSTSEDIPPFALSSGGDVTVNGGTIAAHSGVALFSNGDITVNGGTIATDNYIALISGGFGTVTVTGGSIIAGADGTAIAGGDVFISGGLVSATNRQAISTEGNVTISGGTVSVVDGTAIANYSFHGGNITISGGTVTAGEGGRIIWRIYVNIAISGGTVTSAGDLFVSVDGNVDLSGGAVSGRLEVLSKDVTVSGDVAISGEIDTRHAVIVKEGATLTVPENQALTIQRGSRIINHGTIQNEGVINNCGALYSVVGGIAGTGGITGNPTNSMTALPSIKFTDVAESDWFYDGVLYVYEQNLMNGVSESRFDPDNTLTRGMLVTILYRYADEPDANAAGNTFSDVPDGRYYSDAVIWAAKNGIVQGRGNGIFAPDDKITFEELAVILYRMMTDLALEELASWKELVQSASNYDEQAYYKGPASEWAREAVEMLAIMGIFRSFEQPGELLDIKSDATRAETAMILYWFLDLYTERPIRQ